MNIEDINPFNHQFGGANHFTYKTGFSLRDLFALEAMKILLDRNTLNGYDYIAELAYGMADGMLKSRDKQSEEK